MILEPEEIRVILPPENISTESWGEKYRDLSVMTSASAGRWNMSAIPFFRPVLDALDDDDIELVCAQKATQIAGTETMLTWLGRQAHQDPGPAMLCLADEDTAGEICERRLQPMFRNSPAFTDIFDERKANKTQITLKNLFSLVMAWASSIARTASRPIRYLVLDEICKPSYGLTQEEGSVITRIMQRTETFPNRKIAMLSTVTVEGDNMSKQMALCDAVYDWHVPCPHCGAFQPLLFFSEKYRNMAGDVVDSGCVVFEKGDSVCERAETARYQCGYCHRTWTTAQKNAAVSLGKSVCRTILTKKPRRVGFHISRLLSLFPGGKLESLAENFLLAKDDPLELQSFYNNSLAKHWIQRISKPQDESQAVVMACRREYPRGIVPEETVAIIIGVDMQNDGYYYRVRAFAADKTSWGIDENFVATDDELETVIFKSSWPTKSGRMLKCFRCLIDTGGGQDENAIVSRTEEAYEFIRRNMRRGVQILGSKGSSRSMPTKIKIGQPIDKMPSGKPIPGGIQIVQINTDAMKDELWNRIERSKKDEPGAWYIHAETREWLVRQITAEERQIIKGVNEWVLVRRDNHILDCECLCLAAADPEFWGGVRVLAKKPVSQPQRPARQDDKPSENPWTAGTGY